MTGPGERGLVVVKVGGGLSSIPGALETVAAGVARLARRQPVVVVPGGGPLADAVRELDRRVQLSDDAAHWMAILAMDQYAHLLAERIDGARLVDEPGSVLPALAGGRVVVLAPYRWMRAADVLPHTWDATSDSVAAFVAGALDAERLLLIKPCDGAREALVDRCFAEVVPAGLRWTAIEWRRAGEL